MVKKKKENYWGERQDELMLIWFNKNSSDIEKTKVYREITPVLNHMARNILSMYFSVPFDKRPDLIADAINHLLLEGGDTYNESKRTKLFSYCGTILRNYFYDVVVLHPKRVNNIFALVDDTNDINDSQYLFYDDVDFDEFDYTERDFQYRRIISHFKSIKKKHEDYIKKQDKLSAKKRNDDNYWYDSAKEKIQVIDSIILYFETYFMQTKVSLMELSDFVRNTSKIKQYRIESIVREVIGSYSQITKYEKKESKKELKKKKKNISYIQDDYPINEITNSWNSVRRKIKDDSNQYSYF